LEDEGETFQAEVHADQTIYLGDPTPAVPARQSANSKAPSQRPAGAGLFVWEGEKGGVVADYLEQRVRLWDGAEQRARCWHLLVRREIDGVKLKFCLSNAKPEANLRRLADMQAARHFFVRAFEDAKGACGMADYQVRGWQAWHHHMALVMVARMFLAKERLAHRETSDLLSCNDLIEILCHHLPTKINTDDDRSPRISLTENKPLSSQRIPPSNPL